MTYKEHQFSITVTMIMIINEDDLQKASISKVDQTIGIINCDDTQAPVAKTKERKSSFWNLLSSR